MDRRNTHNGHVFFFPPFACRYPRWASFFPMSTETATGFKRRRVMITGGTGFLGQGLTRAIMAADIDAHICIYSRGEYPQALMRQAIPDPEARLHWFIGDVRDQARLRRAMQGVDLVIHAAALKRVEVGEYNPTEMVLTNVLGAMNVIEAATDASVQKVVAISSDKACAPLNAYGATKLTMEKLMLAANNARGKTGPRFAVCRYGNVAGSTGSVIPTWRARAAAQFAKAAQGQDPNNIRITQCTQVPVTDPTCTRFWMTQEEACELVLWTARRMEGGELVVPILRAYRLGDLAQAMGFEPQITGMGPGEKKDEMMISEHETAGFKYVKPYLVKGGIANTAPEASNVEGIKTGMMSVEQLRERLKEVQ